MEFRTFRLCGCRHGTQCIPQENMKSAAGFLSVWFSLFARLFRPFSCPEARGSSYFPSEHTMYPPAFSVYVCETLFYCAFSLYDFFALSLRENCLVACFVQNCLVACFVQNLLFTCFVRNLLHLIYRVTHAALNIESSTHNDVLVIRCIIIRRCIFGRFICICWLVYG